MAIGMLGYELDMTSSHDTVQMEFELYCLLFFTIFGCLVCIWRLYLFYCTVLAVHPRDWSHVNSLVETVSPAFWRMLQKRSDAEC